MDDDDAFVKSLVVTALLFAAFAVGLVIEDDYIYYPVNKVIIPTDTLIVNNDTTFIYEIDRKILVDEVIIKGE